MYGKEGIGPAVVIPASATSSQANTVPEDTAQPHPNPLVQWRERELMAVFKVFKPAHQGAVDVRDGFLQAFAVGTSGFGPDGVLELLEALLARPTIASLEVVAQEVEAAPLGRVHDAGLASPIGP